MHEAHQQPAARLASGLRFGTHNVRGLRADTQQQLMHLTSTVKHWVSLQLDVVFLQETHLRQGDIARTTSALQAALAQLHAPGYTAHWACNTDNSAGVGILIHAGRLASGDLVATKVTTHGTDGRLLSARLQWRGHAFTAVCAYLPSGDPAGQRGFISSRLHPLYAAVAGSLVLAVTHYYNSRLSRHAGRRSAHAGRH